MGEVGGCGECFSYSSPEEYISKLLFCSDRRQKHPHNPPVPPMHKVVPHSPSAIEHLVMASRHVEGATIMHTRDTEPSPLRSLANLRARPPPTWRHQRVHYSRNTLTRDEDGI
jgi:hypothetical protein